MKIGLMLRCLLLSSLAPVLASCGTLISIPDRGVSDEDLDRLNKQCEIDGHTIWFEPKTHIDNLISLYRVENPAANGGALVPLQGYDSYSAPGEAARQVLSLGLSQVYVNISPNGRFDDSPWPDEPAGVYKYTAYPPSTPECKPGHTWSTANSKDSATCLKYAYVGKFSSLIVSENTYIVYQYEDNFGVKGIIRWVYEVRHGPKKVVARSVFYSIAAYNWTGPKCFDSSKTEVDLYSDLNARKFQEK